MPKSEPRFAGAARWILLAILMASALLRLARLDDVPPGLTHDEANNVADAAGVLAGVRPFYFPVAQGKEPLYPYSVAGAMALLGETRWVMRLTSALWGLLQVVAIYAWSRRLFGERVALLLAAGLAVAFWPVSTARMGLRAITLPAVFAVFTWSLWHRPGREFAAPLPFRSALAAGLLLGLSMYTYLAARIMPAVLLAFGLYLVLCQRAAWRANRWRLALVVLVGALVAAPLFVHLARHPLAEIRLGQLDRPLQALLAGDASLIIDRTWQSLKMFSFSGDTFVPYNIPGKPLFGPLMSLFFYAGLLLAIVRWRRPGYAFALLWFAVGFFPALATGVEASNLRAIVAQPMLYLFPALALDSLAGWFQKRFSSRIAHSFIGVALVALFAATGALTWRDYFSRWAEDRDVRVHYHADLIAIAREIAANPSGAVAVSALYPGEYHDPQVVAAVLGQRAADVRWFDGRSALVFPLTELSRLIVPASVPLAPELAAGEGEWQFVERVAIRPADFTPWFDVWQLPAAAGPPDHTPRARLGDVLALLDVRLLPSQWKAGETALVLTSWEITGRLSPEREAVLFAQLLDQGDGVAAQDDRLDVPSWGWHPGDRFQQILRLTVPVGLAPGDYRLILGAYTVADRVDAVLAGHVPDPASPRLPVAAADGSTADHIAIPVRLVDE